MQMPAHAEQLSLLAVCKLFHGMLHWLQQHLRPQCVAPFSLNRLPPRVSHPLAGSPVYGMSLSHADRLCALGCGIKGRLVRLLSLGVGCHIEPQSNIRACHSMMFSTVRRVASKPMVAIRVQMAKDAAALCASGHYADAADPLQRAIHMGDLPSLALQAWLHIFHREGVVQDGQRGFQLVVSPQNGSRTRVLVRQ